MWKLARGAAVVAALGAPVTAVGGPPASAPGGDPVGPAASAMDVPYQGSGVIALGPASLRLDGRRVSFADGRVLAEALYTAPVHDGDHLCVADEGPEGLGRLRCWDSALRAVTLAEGGRPGRLVLGLGFVAWVAAPAGLPQVWVAPVDGSGSPRALTNVGLRYVPGRQPDGFVPPPLRASLRFDGDLLRWDTADGPREVRWR